MQKKKSHTCKEGGTHLRISFSHLLMNFEKPEKSEFWKNENKFVGDIIILHMCTKNHDHMLCSWDMARDTCNCYFSYWAIFCPFISLTAQKIKISTKKKEKNVRRYHHFTHVYQKLWLDDVRFLRHGAQRTDGRTDGKSDI